MKTYTFNKLDNLIEETIKSRNFALHSIYLDKLNNGEFSVCFDEYNKGIFDNLEDAEIYYHELVKQQKLSESN